MALIVSLKVVPQSGKSLCVLDSQGRIKCFLKSAPEKGAANKELIRLISKGLKVPQIDIEIMAGLISRNKKIKVHRAFTLEQFCEKMGISYQEKLF
jgi:uncharacterized protein (TIGR00251 family)